MLKKEMEQILDENKSLKEAIDDLKDKISIASKFLPKQELNIELIKTLASLIKSKNTVSYLKYVKANELTSSDVDEILTFEELASDVIEGLKNSIIVMADEIKKGQQTLLLDVKKFEKWAALMDEEAMQRFLDKITKKNPPMKKKYHKKDE